MLHLPHHDPSARWVSNPTPSPGDRVTVEVDVPAPSGYDRVMMRAVRDGEAEWHDGVAVASPTGTSWRFELPCDNVVNGYRFRLSGPPGAHWLNGAGVVEHDPLDHHDFRLVTNGGTPGWVPETVWYQIFPDRFARSTERAPLLPDWAWLSDWDDPVATGPRAMTQIYGGDLDGIAQRLDHLVDLGVGGIYLTPFFEARSNHRYDAESFDRVDPLLGGDDALVRLVDACHRVGIRVIGDLTLNHTGVGHDWFGAAQADVSAPERGFYFFDGDSDRYESWLGVSSLPKLDHSSAELRRRFYDGPDSTLGRYLREPFDLDGWRIDVANMTGRHALADLNGLVRRTARSTMRAIDPDTWLVGEHFFDASGDLRDDGWHGVMNYAGFTRPVMSWLGEVDALSLLTAGPGQDPRDGVAVARAMDDVRASLPWQAVLGSMILLGSHDTARWRTIARSDDLALVGVGLLMSLPGSPSVFYGDELGLTGSFNEPARAPMPWAGGPDRGRLLAEYRRLIAMRRDSEALARGGFRWVERTPDALAFLRESRDERVLVRATRAPTAALHVPSALLDATHAELLGGSGAARRDDAGWTWATDDPSCAVWRLS